MVPGQLSGTALRCGLDDRWFESRQRLDLFTTVSRPALGPTQPPIQWVTGSLSLVLKRPWDEPDHSPPSSAEVNNAWSYTSTPQYVFMTWCTVKEKRRNNFTFTLYSNIFPSVPRSSEWSLHFRFSDLHFVRISHVFRECYMQRPPNTPWLDHPNNIWWSVQVMKSFIM
jgi:hypothetical protein